MIAIGRPDMAQDPHFSDNAGRVQFEDEIDLALSTWCRGLGSKEVLEILDASDVPSGPIYSAADMLGDPHFNARGLFEDVQVNGEPLKIPAMIPKLSETPGETAWAGPDIGSHNAEIFGKLFGLDEMSQEALKNDGVI